MNSNVEQAATRMRQHIGHFVELTDEEWNALLPHLTSKTLLKDQYPLQQGNLANQIGVLKAFNLYV